MSRELYAAPHHLVPSCLINRAFKVVVGDTIFEQAINDTCIKAVARTDGTYQFGLEGGITLAESIAIDGGSFITLREQEVLGKELNMVIISLLGVVFIKYIDKILVRTFDDVGIPIFSSRAGIRCRACHTRFLRKLTS